FVQCTQLNSKNKISSDPPPDTLKVKDASPFVKVLQNIGYSSAIAYSVAEIQIAIGLPNAI
ncbi:hypothetical protein A2U01_0058393, partial [Trifolium medium]|nr:hypothetical protein [Trifolium medium]